LDAARSVPEPGIDDGGFGMLHYATRYEDYQTVGAMVAAGCDPCARRPIFNDTALHEAIKQLKTKSLAHLLKSPRLLLDNELKADLLRTAEATQKMEPAAKVIVAMVKKICD
jgi:hypothetical protein